MEWHELGRGAESKLGRRSQRIVWGGCDTGRNRTVPDSARRDRIRQLRSEAPHEESVSRLFSEDFEDLAREVLQTERDTVIELRNEEAINDQALRRIQRDIDLAEARLQRPTRKSR